MKRVRITHSWLRLKNLMKRLVKKHKHQQPEAWSAETMAMYKQMLLRVGKEGYQASSDALSSFNKHDSVSEAFAREVGGECRAVAGDYSSLRTMKSMSRVLLYKVDLLLERTETDHPLPSEEEEEDDKDSWRAKLWGKEEQEEREKKEKLAAQFVGDDELAKVVAAAATLEPGANDSKRNNNRKKNSQHANDVSCVPRAPAPDRRGSAPMKAGGGSGPRVAGLEKAQRETTQTLRETNTKLTRMEEAIMEIRSSLCQPSQTTSGFTQPDFEADPDDEFV
jgi:hypothetical protein